MKKKLVSVLFSLTLSVFLFQVFYQDCQALPANVHTTTISGNKTDYEIGVCKNTGTIYKFINKRSDPGRNTVQENNGAACQIAVHSGMPWSLTSNPCANQGYWNPTQSGAACSKPNNTGHKTPQAGLDLNVYCDGNLNNNCNVTQNEIFHSLHRVMNFDYGPDYQGPYHPDDLFHLQQKTTLHNSYVQADLDVINMGIERNSAFEIPTYYFIEDYDHYYFLSDTGIVEGTVSDSTPQGTAITTTGDFITVENPDESQSAITIAWFYSDEFVADISKEYAHIRRAPHEGKNWVKYNNVVGISLKQNKQYKLRYLLIPYKYDQMLPTEYGWISVLNLIDRKKLSSGPTPTPTPTPTSVSCPKPAVPSNITCSPNCDEGLLFSWQDNSNNEDGFRIVKDYFFNVIANVGPNTTSWQYDWCGDHNNHNYNIYPFNQCGDNMSASGVSCVCSACTPTSTPIPGDLNQDGQVDTQDIIILLQNWGPSPSISEADLNLDSIVNVIDFGMMLKLI